MRDAYRHQDRENRLRLALQHQTIPASVPTPATELANREKEVAARAKIDRTFASIRPRYREAITLRLVEELPREHCAQILDVSVATFDVIFHRAIRAFRKTYGEDN